MNLLLLIMGLAYTGALGVAIWRTRLVGWRRAAGFAVLAMPWFAFGFKASMAVYSNAASIFEILGALDALLVWFVGLFAAGVWVTLAGLILLPFLRSRASVALLFAASAVPGVLAGVIATAAFWELQDAMPYVVAAWCAVYAAAFSMTLPRARPGGHQIASRQGDPGQEC